MTNLLLVSGSQRRESFNTRLLQHLKQYLDGRCTIDTLDSTQVNLPLFNQDLEANQDVTDHVVVLHRRIEACQGIIVASPEYNGQLTPYLKNLIDWVSRIAYIDNRFVNPFLGRPLLLCSASTGWSGGEVGIPYARALFCYVGCQVIDDAICIPYADQAWSDEGYLFDPFLEDQIIDATDRILELAENRVNHSDQQQEAA